MRDYTLTDQERDYIINLILLDIKGSKNNINIKNNRIIIRKLRDQRKRLKYNQMRNRLENE